jgi:hypothetical protein
MLAFCDEANESPSIDTTRNDSRRRIFDELLTQLSQTIELEYQYSNAISISNGSSRAYYCPSVPPFQFN